MNRLPLAFGLILSFSSVGAYAQSPAPGFPTYGSFDGDGLARINLQNLNVNLVFPIMSGPGRSLNTYARVSYNSSVWNPSAGFWYPVVDQSGASSWGWNEFNFVGVLNYTSAKIQCGTHLYDFYMRYSHFVYVDTVGTNHSFNVTFTVAGTCGTTSGSRTGYATNGSGYYLNASGGTWVVLDRSGDTISPVMNGSLKDSNGNFISATTNSSNSSETDWTDSRGTLILKVLSAYPNWQYQFMDSTGSYQTSYLNVGSFNMKSNFGCSGVTEYTGTANLPISLLLPNSQGYSISYESTPGSTGYYTGRIQQVLLPAGGTIQFQYSGANDGTSCTDGSTLQLSVIRNGIYTTTYSRTQVGSNWRTTITYPQLPYDSAPNQTVVTFNSASQEVSRQVYQGSASPANLLRTITTSWAANGTPASQTVVLEDGSTAVLTETSYDTFGNLLSMKAHDWGTVATPGAVLKNTAFSYLSTTAYTNLNTLNRLTDETVADANGTIHYRKHIDYDSPASLNSPCPAGVPGHDDTNYGCSFTTRGDPTAVTTYTDANTPAGGITKNFHYDVFGNLVQADLDCCQTKKWNFSATTQYAFPDSIVSGATGGTQLTTSKTYNSDGSVSTSTDENGKVTSYSYDTTGRVTSITRPDQAKATYGYADSANSVTVSAPIDATNMLKRQSTYDGLGRIRKVTVLDGTNKSYQIVETQYDPVGRAYKVSNPHNSTAQFWTETRYDALGRPTLVIPPDGSSTSNNKKYTYSGNTVIVTDPSGKMTKRQADGLGRATKVFEPDVSNGNTLTQETDLSYSSTDALLQVTQGIQTRNYTYDDLGRVLTAKTPETNQAPISYQYNGFSLVTQRTDARGVVTTYSYDSLNRLSQTSYNVGATGIPATPNVNLTYDEEGGAAANSLGRLTTLSDGTGTEKYTYDILGESTQLKKAVNGTQYILGYAYNLAGELTSITYPSGRVVQENYDAIGQLCAVGASGATCTTGTNYASGFAYSPAGEVTGFNYGNGVTASLTYTPDRLALQSLSYAKGTQTLLSWNYWYKTDTTNCPNAPAGNNGQVQCITDNVDSGRSVAYTYDALYRLSTAVTTGSASYPKWGLSWAYDRYGNRNAQSILSGCLAPMTCPTNSVPVDPSTNRLLPPPYAYDANGNMTNDGTNTLAYDAASQLITSTNGGNAAAYVYDGHGIRIRKCAPNCGSPASSTIYIFSGSKVIAEYDNGAAVASPSREYIYSGAQLLAKSESGALTYYHSDHLSNRATTDSSGNVLAQRAHYPFGETWYESGAASKLKFTTYERDSETGNDFAMARYAVSGLGRFSSPDALAGSALAPQSMNRFSYVQNDPINAADPSGLVRTPWGFAFSEVGFGSSWNEFDLLTGAFVLQGVSVNWHIAINPELTAEDTSAWFVIDSIEPVYGGLLMDPGGPGGGAQARIDRARNQARLLLSDPDCADFLKGLIAAISRTSKDGVSLDDFLKGFDSLTIVPTPQGDPQGGGSTIAHVDEVGKDSVIHVDMPFYSGLAPTLLHEDFHTILFGEYDTGLAHNIWKSTGAVGDDPGSFSPDDASIYNHNAFAQHCKTKNK